MSKENVMRFFENTKTDQDLKSQYQEIMRRFTQEDISEELINTVEQDLISLAKSAGYDFSLKELSDFKKTESKQLSEEELDKIVGGSGRYVEYIYPNGWTIGKVNICNGPPNTEAFINKRNNGGSCSYYSHDYSKNGIDGCCQTCVSYQEDVEV